MKRLIDNCVAIMGMGAALSGLAVLAYCILAGLLCTYNGNC